MEKILYSEITIICGLVMAVVWLSDIRKSRGPVLIGQKIFRILLWTNMGAMLFDLIQVLYNGTTYKYSYLIENVTILFYYVLQSVIGYIFVLYADYELYPDNKRFKRNMYIYSIPAVLMVLMSISSIWNGCYFIIDETNSYVRGAFFHIPTVISFGYIFYVFCLLTKYKRENMLETSVQRDLYMRLLLFPLAPCMGAVLQILLPGSAWIFPGTTMAILINYVMVQNSQMARDHLTGLYNRSQLESFMNYQLKNLKKGNYFFLILLDLDKFKVINDTYGHIVGDDALIQAAKLLRGSCKRKSDYVIRLGGDEFVIIGQCENVEAVDMIVNRMQEEAINFNKSRKREYQLSFSAGYAIYDGTSQATLDTLISEADQRMYEIKNAKAMKEKTAADIEKNRDTKNMKKIINNA